MSRCRTFSYGFSSSLKAAGMMKVSKNFNSSLDDLESEMDAEMQDIDLLHDSNPFKFSSDIMDSLSSPKQRSFTVREARDDGYNSKKNSHFSHHNDNEWDDRTTFQYPSFFDEREPDISWKTWQSRNDDNAADNLIYRDYVMSDFAFDGPRKPTRTTWKVIDKFDVLGSTFSFSKNETSEYDSDFLISNQARYPTVERKYDFKPETSKPDCFSFMTEDARDNSSLQSEESCSSSAVRYQGTDTSPSNLISRQGRIRGQGGGFSSSSDKYGVKNAFAKESKDDVQQKDIASGIAKQPNVLKSSESKPWHHASSFSREKLETRSIWYFEEGHTAVDISPGSRCFNQNPGAKNTFFDSEFWGEDPFSKFPTPKSRIGVDPLGDGFDSEPVAYSPSNCFTSKKIPLNDSSTISKLDFPPDSQLRNGPQGSPCTAGFQGETLSPDLLAQESFSKDDEKVNMKLSDFCDSFEPGEEICLRNEGLVSKEKAAVEASHSKNDNEREPREARDAVFPQMERVTTTVFPKPVEETLLSPSVDITDKSGSIKDESRYVI
ncbi:hypothetical protein L484_010656 [Morus notabilis]|uniref:Uncharacterized protein n=1 Tax=Morus notabilis TaxID=981085 RepID=W9SNY7_9ROSA|nr:hypothetical protein L484_010656 [Morus notabilis]